MIHIPCDTQLTMTVKSIGTHKRVHPADKGHTHTLSQMKLMKRNNRNHPRNHINASTFGQSSQWTPTLTGWLRWSAIAGGNRGWCSRHFPSTNGIQIILTRIPANTSSIYGGQVKLLLLLLFGHNRCCRNTLHGGTLGKFTGSTRAHHKGRKSKRVLCSSRVFSVAYSFLPVASTELVSEGEKIHEKRVNRSSQL